MGIPATRDGKEHLAVFLFAGAGHFSKQSGRRGAAAPVWTRAHMLQFSIHTILLFSSPAAHRAPVLDRHPVKSWTPVARGQGL